MYRAIEMSENIVEEAMYASKGDIVRKFDGSHETLGTMILRFSTMNERLI